MSSQTRTDMTCVACGNAVYVPMRDGARYCLRCQRISDFTSRPTPTQPPQGEKQRAPTPTGPTNTQNNQA